MHDGADFNLMPVFYTVFRIAEVVHAEIKSSTTDYLRDRGKGGSFVLRVEVDILLLGFDSDGGFGYNLSSILLHELLSMSSMENTCPTIWETDQPASICLQPTFVILTPPSQGILQAESIIKEHLVEDREKTGEDSNSGSDPVKLFKVEASGDFEDRMLQLLDESYMIDGVSATMDGNTQPYEHRLAMIILNPDKRRLQPGSIRPGLASDSSSIEEAKVLDNWRHGLEGVREMALLSHESGFAYRYSFGGIGASASFLSSHNFVLVDISAGPASYGPLTASDALVHSPQIPRLLPMFLSMETELKHVGFGTLRTRMLDSAEVASSRMFAGSLSEVIQSATHHLFVPDLKFKRLEHARQVIVPIICLHDGDDEELDKATIDLDTVSLQILVDSLMDASQTALLEVSDVKKLHSFPNIISALHKSQVSSLSRVMMDTPPWTGLQKSLYTHIDSDSLLRELLSSLPELPDDSVAHSVDPDVDNEKELSQHARHQGSRIFPIFYLTLSSSTLGNSHLTTEDRQLWAANHDGAFVIRMSGTKETLFSGHEIEGRPIFINSSIHATTNIAASILTGLTGQVPSYERRVNGIKHQDWRWSLGATPLGPYQSSFRAVSGVIKATGRRNFFISHIESALSAVNRRLKRLDAQYVSGGRSESKLEDPFAFLFKEGVDISNQTSMRSLQANLLDEMLMGRIGSNSSDILMDSSTIHIMSEMLNNIETKLEEIGWALYSMSYDSARSLLITLLAQVDRFVKLMDKKLDLAEDLAACCSLKFHAHQPSEGHSKALYIILGLVIAFILVTIRCFDTKKSRPILRTTGPSFSTQRGLEPRVTSTMQSPERSSGSIMSWLGERPSDELPSFSKSYH